MHVSQGVKAWQPSRAKSIAPITAQSSSGEIKRLQGLLIDAGFLQKGQDTGTMGPATSAALKSLQQTHNKAPSGAFFIARKQPRDHRTATETEEIDE